MAKSSKPSAELRARREEIVRAHMDAENRHEFDAALDTFHHPRYELIATGDVYDGADAVKTYYDETRTAFPDQRNELVKMHHAEDAIILEFILAGTHTGPYRGIPPTGRAFRCQMTAIMMFENDQLVAERVYFDSATILRALGLAHDPLTLTGRIATLASHPVTFARAFGRQLFGRGRGTGSGSGSGSGSGEQR